MPKANKATVNERTHAVALMLVEGKTRAQILQNAAEWDIAERTVEDYIARATELLAAESAAEFVSEFGKAKRRLELLFERTFAREDYGRALAVVKELNTLLGLYPPTRTATAVGVMGVSWQPPVIRQVAARGELPTVEDLSADELERVVRAYFLEQSARRADLPPIPESTLDAILRDGTPDEVYGSPPWPPRHAPAIPADDLSDILR